MTERRVEGVAPWLPWPFRAWSWWTEPVRAERLAVVRIGLAAFLLVDILSSYAPHLILYFAGDWFGRSEVLAGHADPPRLHWTLLRGLSHPLESALFTAGWALSTCLVLFSLCGRLTVDPEKRPEEDPGTLTSWSLVLWIICTVLALPGLMGRSYTANDYTLVWLAPLLTWMLATGFVLLALGTRLRGFERPSDRSVHWLIGSGWLVSTMLLGLGLWLVMRVKEELPMPAWLGQLLSPWNDSHAFVIGALVVWIVATLCLLIGFWSRTSAAVIWALSLSFANLNPYIDNAGDTVRGILLFYLMVSPCGAAWSVDAWRRRIRQATRLPHGPAFVHPWPLRLLFIQMALIYFFNGLYKVVSSDWRSGESLYYVMRDLNLTRFSVSQVPMPFWLTQFLTWAVLVWEVGFPLWVALPWTRKVALWFGVGFHVGIGMTMELGGFAPYMLIMYLPLLPWERWRDRFSFRDHKPRGEPASPGDTPEARGLASLTPTPLPEGEG